ncbi:hypothetical protein [Lentzea sp. E54]|uniref:hypothetical protein n=1 Tax=Lentzea xerophila TaxID=3435883 RepID=UPI003DA6B8C9
MASWSRHKKHRPALRAGPLTLSATAALVASLLVAPAAHAATVSTLDSNNRNCHSWLFGIAHQVHQANYFDYQGNWEMAHRADTAGYELASRSSELDKCGSLPEPQRSSWDDVRSTVQTSLGYGNGAGQITASQCNMSLSIDNRYWVDKYGVQRDNYTEALGHQNNALVALRPWTGLPRTVTASTSVEGFGLGLSQVQDVLVSHDSGSYG